MSRPRGRGRVWIFVLLLVVPGLPGSAQDRPTLERLEQSACVAADVRGDEYRPVFCEARCGCASGVDLGSASSCVEVSPGVVRVLGPILTVDAVCVGLCTTSPPFLCENDSICNGAGTCSFAALGRCAETNYSLGCTTDLACDQAQGFSCSIPYLGAPPNSQSCAGPTACTAEGPCATLQQPEWGFSFGFVPSGDLSPLTCSATGEFMNGTDASECVAQIEAHLGAGACVICGDGNLDAGEQCDDGNLSAGDGCAPDCTSE